MLCINLFFKLSQKVWNLIAEAESEKEEETVKPVAEVTTEPETKPEAEKAAEEKPEIIEEAEKPEAEPVAEEVTFQNFQELSKIVKKTFWCFANIVYYTTTRKFHDHLALYYLNNVRTSKP